MGDVAAIQLVGGDLAIDFVNTLGGLPDVADDEYLFGYADLLTWCEVAGALSRASASALRQEAERQPQAAVAEHGRVLGLRAGLDRVLRARIGEQDRADDGLRVVSEHAAEATAAGRLVPEGDRYGWAWPPSPALALPRRRLAVAALDLLRAGPLDRLTRCGHCRWLFLDTSRNRSRRWCSMRACGSVVKMRRYRAARRE